MTYTTTVTKTGQIFLPKAVREALGILPGQRLKLGINQNSLTVEKTMSVDEAMAYFNSIPRTKKMQKAIEEYRGLTVNEAINKWAASPEGKKIMQKEYGR